MPPEILRRRHRVSLRKNGFVLVDVASLGPYHPFIDASENTSLAIPSAIPQPLDSSVFQSPNSRAAMFLSAAILVGFLSSPVASEEPDTAADRSIGTAKVGVFRGNWALVLPDGSAGWLTIFDDDGKPQGQLWAVGLPKALTDVSIDGDTLHFVQNHRLGKPEFEGGPPTGPRVPCRHRATVEGDQIKLVMDRPRSDGSTEQVRFVGKRMPPIPPKPDLSQVTFGKPIELFNGHDLEGWKLTNPNQINGWKAVDGMLINTTPKLDFQPYSRYGNLQTVDKFLDFNLQIEFNVPPGGNSGVYLRGVYEAQVVDRDSKMQGIQGVGAIFGRIAPSENAGKPGGQWQQYDITLVDRHVTVILNGKKVIDNQPIAGCTNGALQADETIPGSFYLQGDHTAVRYRNIVLRPVIKN